MTDFVTGRTAPDFTFTEVLQAHAAGLLSDREAADVLRRIRPDWFPTEGHEGVNPNGSSERFAVVYDGKRAWDVRDTEVIRRNRNREDGTVASFWDGAPLPGLIVRRHPDPEAAARIEADRLNSEPR